MNCPICKSENDPKNKFCIVCGTKIKDVDFINNINLKNIKSEASDSSSKSIQIINTVIHGGISLEGTAYGREEGFHLNLKRHNSICPNCGNIIRLSDKVCPECKAILR